MKKGSGEPGRIKENCAPLCVPPPEALYECPQDIRTKKFMFMLFFLPCCSEQNQRAPKPPQFAQPGLSRSNGSHPQREGTTLSAFVPTGWYCPSVGLQMRVRLICHVDLLKRACANSGGFGAR